jgi:hypothetical protein
MRAMSRLTTVMAAAAWSASPTVAAGDTPTTTREAELMGVITDLRERVEQLETMVHAEDPISAERARQIEDLVSEVLADADTRASRLQEVATAGHDSSGFYLASADGGFRLNFAGQMQFRFVSNHQDNSATDDHRSGFEMRRAKLFFFGHVVDPSWQYFVEVDASRSGGGFALGENVWVQKDLGDGWKVLAGQFKPQYLREETISSRRLQTLERSLVNSKFTVVTTQGVQVSYETDMWRVFGSFNDGRASGGAPWDTEDTEYAFTARAEWLAQGAWGHVTHDVAFPDLDPAILVGGALLYQEDEFGTSTNNAEAERLGLTADVTFKLERGSVSGAFVYEDVSTAAGADMSQIAFLVRGGYFVADDIEVYGAYEWGDLDTAGVEDLSIVTVGATKYFKGHSLKWTTDVGFALDEVSASWATAGAGWRADSPGEDGQIVIRSQLQLLF